MHPKTDFVPEWKWETKKIKVTLHIKEQNRKKF